MPEQTTPSCAPAQDQAEEWRDVPGFPRYQVSDLGRARKSCGGGRGRPRWWKYLKPGGSARQPYPQIFLSRDACRHVRYVHTLVLRAFVGPPPGGMECRHLDGDPGNNRLANLCWGTHKENIADRERHGRTARGDRSGARLHPEKMIRLRSGRPGPAVRSKLTETEVLAIRKRAAAGEGQEALACFFGVTRSAVGYIVRRKRWAHI